MKKSILILISIILFISSYAQNITYYVSNKGDDNNNGLNQFSAWKTIEKINKQRFLPGDAILFEGGEIFIGNLTLTADEAGTASSPIQISSYGNGKAIIYGGYGDAIFINNTEYIEIKNIIVKGNGRYNSNGTGVYIEINSNEKMLAGIVIDHVEASGFYWSGIGVGIHTGITKGFENLRITNCLVYENGFAGIQITGAWDNATGTSSFNHKGMYIAYTKAFKNHGLKNYTSNWSGTGILMAGVENGIIEYCEAFENGAENGCSGGGPVGIWLANTKNCVIQYCESYSNKASLIRDGGGFDIDGGAQDCIIQYCYSHDNDGPGYALFEWGNNIPFTNNIIRYNISQNDARKNSYGSITFWGVDANHKIMNSEVYNNTIYVSKDGLLGGTPAAIKFMGANMKDVKIRNNIFYVTEGIQMLNASSTFDTTAVHFQNNNYWDTTGTLTFHYRNTYNSLAAWKAAAQGQEMKGKKSLGFNKDPMFINPGGGKTINPAEGGDLTYLTAYMLHPQSNMIDVAMNLKNEYGLKVGKKDYYNNILDENGLFDLGANEFNPAKFIVMPMKFTMFNAYQNKDDLFIEWEAEAQEHVKAFYIELSTDGKNFNVFKTFIPNNANHTYHYNEVINFNSISTIYCRIKSINDSKKITYSTIIKLATNKNEKIKIYPNPVKDQLNLITSLPYTKILIKNIQGEIVLQKDIYESGNIQLSVNALSTGIYFVELYSKITNDKSFINFIKL